MTALSIQPTYPIFTDIDGQPLDSGYVYIGQANLDPQGNPINVYWDAALTQLAAQPIRTLNGYPSNSGTPARLYVGSDYSIRVMNKKASTVYNAPTATERFSAVVVGGIDSSEVGYLPAGTGAVATTVQNKLRESVSVKDFGAVGDGVADDTAAIQAALNASKNVFIPAGTYMIDGAATGGFNGLVPSSGTVITMSPDTILKIIPTSSGEYSAIGFLNSDGLVIHGNGAQILGDRAAHTGSTGETGYGIRIGSSTNVNISDLYIADCWGDGVYVGTWAGQTVASEHVLLTNVISDNSRRNGMSLVSATDCTFVNCKFINTNGTSPEAGLDSEPNALNPRNTNCVFINCEFTGNANAAITGPYADGSSNFSFVNCVISGLTGVTPKGTAMSWKSDGTTGVTVFKNCLFTGVVATTEYCDFIGCTFVCGESYLQSVYAFSANTDAPMWMSDCLIKTTGTTRPASFISSTTETSRKKIRGTKFVKDGSTGSQIGVNVANKVSINDCELIHTGTAPASPFYLNGTFDGLDVVLENVIGSTNFTAGGTTGMTYGTSVIKGPNSPESVVTARIGTLFIRTNGSAGTTLYVKESGTGNTGWVAK